MEVKVEEEEDCIQELVKLTLAGGFDLGLSAEYCSHLLRQDPHHNSTDVVTEGVPTYPLYKSLASALFESISSGAFYSPSEKTILIQEKGSELLQMLKTLDFDLHVQEPFFSQLKDGLKTVEGRCAVGDYKRIKPGALILFNKCLVLEVQDVHIYASFRDMLEAESIEKVLPGVKSIEEGVQIYRKFYPEEKERIYGVLAICVTKPFPQLSDVVAFILRELSYEGIQRLLGLVHTEGTILTGLPPPRSSLLSSFLSPHNPNVKSSTLTIGARSLAKHIDRSSLRFWDSAKNMLALDVIRKLMANCCWQNLHTVQPHGGIFEIRVCDGYGARWSEDGSKFIGFLEPYMEEGHTNGWKH